MVKRHFGKCPDFLAWMWCKRTACTKRRNQIIRRLFMRAPLKEEKNENPIIQLFYDLDKR
jgi:hypothetical protein